MSKDDETAKKTVLAVLADKNIAPINFTLGDYSVAPKMYGEVADAIKTNKVTVLVEASLKSTKVQALYVNELKLPNGQFMYNLMLLRDPDLAGGVTDAKQKINTEFNAMMGIVHESTHAGFDARKLKKVTTPYNEGAAYIAGAIFGVAKMRDMGGKPEKIYAGAATTDIHSVAWNIALKLEGAKNRTVPKDSANALFVEIGKMPEYKDKMKDIVTLDGVNQKW
jgi:hypothetical protein